VVPALGGTPRRLADFGSQPSWSHDGKQIAFESGEYAAATESNVSAMPGATIWIVDLGGTGPRQLTKVSTTASLFTAYGDGRPRWSPDDKRILFENSEELWTVAINGTELRPVGMDREAYDPVLSEDGHTVYFLGQDSEGSGLWRVELTSDWKRSGPSVKLHNSAPAAAQYLAYGSGRFAFSIISTQDNLYSISATNEGSFGDPVALTQDTRLRKTWPQFSPDGSQIALFVGQRGRPGQLWVIGPDGKDAKPIPVGEKAFEPAWCGANALCYWSSQDRQGTTLSRWDMDQGRSYRVLSSPEIMSAIRLSPDGKTAAFQKGIDGAINVWLLSLDSGNVRPLTSTAGVTGWPSWSPDGRSLAVEIRDGANTQIGIVPTSGGTARYLTHGAGQNWPYSWSPDGKAIAFAGSRAGMWNVYSVDADSGATRQLTHYTSATSFVRYPEWSPTGRQIVYEYGASRANIWLLDPRK
jgi:Tol biopolymer transport system component